MARPGRKPKPGKRFPCGKRTPKQIEEDIMQTAVEARMRVFGVSMTVAKGNEIGSPLGRLRHWNLITPAQADAGYDFAVTLRDYLSSAKLQRPTQGKAGFVPPMADNGEGPPVKSQAKSKAYMEALRDLDAIERSSPSITSIVWDVCISEHDRMQGSEIGALRVGLNAIHRILYGRKAA